MLNSSEMSVPMTVKKANLTTGSDLTTYPIMFFQNIKNTRNYIFGIHFDYWTIHFRMSSTSW